MNSLQSYLRPNKDRFVQELFDFLRIPSVSADSAFSKDVFKAADFVADSLKKAGCDTSRNLSNQRISYCLWRKTDRP